MLALPPFRGPRSSNHVALEELPAPVRSLPQNKAVEADPDPGDRPAVGTRCAVLCVLVRHYSTNRGMQWWRSDQHPVIANRACWRRHNINLSNLTQRLAIQRTGIPYPHP